MDYEQLFAEFEKNVNAEKARGMSAYMRDQFQYLGINTPLRRSISKKLLGAAKKLKTADWEFVHLCWGKPYREYQYLAVDYLDAVKAILTPVDVPKIKDIAVLKSWWDTIDGLDRIIGDIALRYPEVNATLLNWSLDSNKWLRRIAIDHQLLRKGKTDTELLSRIIENNFGTDELFINKAIGWSLREYSKTDPDWVRGFIERFRDRMDKLSIREASKYIK
jgi:3-methyladenine DNA glycosylase AlkD